MLLLTLQSDSLACMKMWLWVNYRSVTLCQWGSVWRCHICTPWIGCLSCLQGMYLLLLVK